MAMPAEGAVPGGHGAPLREALAEQAEPGRPGEPAGSDLLAGTGAAGTGLDNAAAAVRELSRAAEHRHPDIAVELRLCIAPGCGSGDTPHAAVVLRRRQHPTAPAAAPQQDNGARLPGQRGGDPLAPLTRREHEVLALLAQGRSNTGIAAALVLSDSAVAKHINAIFTKLGLLPAAHTNRRVLAALTYLRSRGTAR